MEMREGIFNALHSFDWNLCYVKGVMGDKAGP